MRFNKIKIKVDAQVLESIGLLTRKVAVKASSTVELTQDSDGIYILQTSSTFRNQKLRFKLGEEFVEERMDGEFIPCVITFKGNSMIQLQMGQKPVKIQSKPVRIVREFTDTELVVTCLVSNIECKRWFKAMN